MCVKEVGMFTILGHWLIPQRCAVCGACPSIFDPLCFRPNQGTRHMYVRTLFELYWGLFPFRLKARDRSVVVGLRATYFVRRVLHTYMYAYFPYGRFAVAP